MEKIIFRIQALFLFLIHAKTKHAAHSPFLYNFINAVFGKTTAEDSLQICLQEKMKLFRDNSELKVTDYGTGSKCGSEYMSSVCKQAKRSLKSKSEVQYLYQFASYYKPALIVEMGTSFGISTMAMSMALPNSVILSFEGCPETAQRAKKMFKKRNIHNISIIIGNIDEVFEGALPNEKTFDLAIVDANHTYEHTLKYFFMLKSMRNSKSVIIFDDIHWSKDINNAWNEIKADKDVQLSVETWNYGFVFFNPDLSKQDFILRKF